jgi:hypothetical protein
LDADAADVCPWRGEFGLDAGFGGGDGGRKKYSLGAIFDPAGRPGIDRLGDPGPAWLPTIFDHSLKI